MKFDLPKWGVIVTIVVGVPTGFLACLQVWSSMSVNKPKLVVFQRTDDIELPVSYKNLLQDLDFSSRKNIAALSEVAASAARTNQDSFYLYSLAESLKTFSSSVPIGASVHLEAITIKVSNVGGVTANNVKVIFPTQGFVEIRKDGSALRGENTDGMVELYSLEPSSRCVVKFWSTKFSSVGDIRVVSDEGIAVVGPEFVSREKNRWVIGLDVFTVVMSLWFVLAGGLILVVSALQLDTYLRTRISK
jgi:hypothetical protein